MRPGSRTEGEVCSVPQWSLAPGDIEAFLHEWRGFHEAFRDGFARREPREQCFGYRGGQGSALERTSIEPMARRVDGGTVRALQRLISDAVWDEGQRRRTYHRLLKDELGEAEGVVIVDASGFPQKGRESVGVARPYCGTLGTVENGQVGVLAASASRQGEALVDKRLFLPEPWWTNAYAARRATCQVPEDLTFHPKPQWAVEILGDIHQEAMLAFTYMVADGLDGNSPAFIEAAEQGGGQISVVSIPSETRCWVQGPVTQPTCYKYTGKERATRVGRPTAQAPLSVALLAKGIHDWFWYRRNVSAGTKGPIEYALTKRQVTLCQESRPYKAGWLVMKRTLGENPP